MSLSQTWEWPNGGQAGSIRLDWFLRDAELVSRSKKSPAQLARNRLVAWACIAESLIVRCRDDEYKNSAIGVCLGAVVIEWRALTPFLGKVPTRTSRKQFRRQVDAFINACHVLQVRISEEECAALDFSLHDDRSEVIASENGCVSLDDALPTPRAPVLCPICGCQLERLETCDACEGGGRQYEPTLAEKSILLRCCYNESCTKCGGIGHFMSIELAPDTTCRVCRGRGALFLCRSCTSESGLLKRPRF